MKRYSKEFREEAVKLMCRVLKVSESGYYQWLRNRSKPIKRQLLPVETLRVFVFAMGLYP